MTESEIHANPHRIQGLAEELKTFVDKLRAELEKMNSGLHDLGSTWRDKEYEKFKHLFDRLQEDITQVDKEISRREPELKEDARLLLNYLNQSM